MKTTFYISSSEVYRPAFGSRGDVGSPCRRGSQGVWDFCAHAYLLAGGLERLRHGGLRADLGKLMLSLCEKVAQGHPRNAPSPNAPSPVPTHHIPPTRPFHLHPLLLPISPISHPLSGPYKMLNCWVNAITNPKVHSRAP